MLVYEGEEVSKLYRTAVTIGKFDGLHIGHKELIDAVVSQKRNGLTAVVFSFYTEKSFLFSEEEKQELLIAAGVDVYIRYPLNQRTKSMQAEQFINEILIHRLHTEVIYTGTDFHFGKDRQGDTALLSTYAGKNAFQLHVIKQVSLYDEIVCSTAIRTYIQNGGVKKAGQLLGKPFFSYFTVTGIMSEKAAFSITGTRILGTFARGKILPQKGIYKVILIYQNESCSCEVCVWQPENSIDNVRELAFSSEICLKVGEKVRLEWLYEKEAEYETD